MSKSINVEDIKDQMSSLVKNNDDIKKLLGSIQTETLVEETILAMQKEAAEWVKTYFANNVIKTEGENNHKFVNKIEKLATQLNEDKIKKHFMSSDISPEHLLNSLYSIQALAN